MLALNRQQKFEDAIRLGKKGIGTASDRQYLHVAPLHYQIGQAHEGRNDIDLAIKRYRLAEAAAKNAEEAARKSLAAANGQAKKVAKAQRKLKGAQKYLQRYQTALERLGDRQPR